MLLSFLVTQVSIVTVFADSLSTPSSSIAQHVVDRVPKPFNISANGTLRITTKLKDGDSFLVFECHCRASRVLMSYTEDPNTGTTVNSSDPALIYQNDDSMAPGVIDPGVYILNPHNYSVVVLAMVKAYTVDDPVPGRCDTRHQHPPPGLSIDWSQAIIRLNFSKASLSLFRCNSPKSVQYRVYHMYLPREGWGQGDRDQQFMEAIGNFSEIEDIEARGKQVNTMGNKVNRLMFASYQPMGSLYAVIATQGNGSSVYALGHTYGCHVDHVTGVCPDTSHTVTKVASAICIFMGLVMAFAGHRFFLTSQFFFGFYAGGFVGFILLSSAHLSFVEIFCLSVLSGFVMAIMVSALWFFLGLPVLSVLLPTLEVGIILASSILFLLPQHSLLSLTDDLYYWLVFLCLMLAMPVILLAFTQKASILSCVILGSTVIAIPVDYFLGTGLRFIFINVVRRASVPKFHLALTLPSWQTEDLMVVACWLGVATAALITQLLVERRKPPFPPAPFQQWRWRREMDMEGEDSETAPLLSDEDSLVDPVSSPVVGYIIGHRPVTGIPQASPVTVRTTEILQGRGRPNGVRVPMASTRGRDIFKPPSPEESRPYLQYQQYSPRQGEGVG